MEDWRDDIYFDERYCRVNERIELGEAVHYEYQSDNGIIISNFVKRRIPLRDVDGDWFDIRTPYGYGGPLIVKAQNKEKLIEEYKKDFALFCKNNGIVTEFVRFHPIANNAMDFKDVYIVSFDRNTVGTDLCRFKDPIKAEFSKSCRKNIRRAISKGLTYKVEEKVNGLERFQSIYYETMERNNAIDFYFFEDKYFEDLVTCLKEKLLVVYVYYENRIVAAGLCFVSHNTIHIHLSGTLNEYMALNPPYVLRYAVTMWAIEHGIRYIHHGGGRTSAQTDALYVFKKQFGINTDFDFFIGEKTWNSRIYEEVCKQKLPDERVNDYIRRIRSEKNNYYSGGWRKP